MDKSNNKGGERADATSLSQEEVDAAKYPGVAIDIADDEKVDENLVKERTKALNNNPRNNGKII